MGSRGQSSAMALVPRSATPPRWVPKVEALEQPNRTLLPDVRRGSNDSCSGPRRYYESIVVEEHSHVLMVLALSERRTTHKQALREEKENLWKYINALDYSVPILKQAVVSGCQLESVEDQELPLYCVQEVQGENLDGTARHEHTPELL